MQGSLASKIKTVVIDILIGGIGVSVTELQFLNEGVKLGVSILSIALLTLRFAKEYKQIRK